MLLYVEGIAFPAKTFVLSASPRNKVAFVKAHLFHLFHDAGIPEFSFRLTYNGRYLRDGLPLSHYDIKERCRLLVIRNDFDVSASSSNKRKGQRYLSGAAREMKAVHKELAHFEVRESVINALSLMMWIYIVTGLPNGETNETIGFLTLFSTLWYISILTMVIGIWCLGSLPTFNMHDGYLKSNVHHEKFLRLSVTLLLTNAIVVTLVCLASVLAYVGTSGWNVWLATALERMSTWIRLCPISVVDGSLACTTFSLQYNISIYGLTILLAVIAIQTHAVLLENMRVKVASIVEKAIVSAPPLMDLSEPMTHGTDDEKKKVVYDIANYLCSEEAVTEFLMRRNLHAPMMEYALNSPGDYDLETFMTDILAEILQYPGGRKILMSVTRNTPDVGSTLNLSGEPGQSPGDGDHTDDTVSPTKSSPVTPAPLISPLGKRHALSVGRDELQAIGPSTDPESRWKAPSIDGEPPYSLRETTLLQLLWSLLKSKDKYVVQATMECIYFLMMAEEDIYFTPAIRESILQEASFLVFTWAHVLEVIHLLSTIVSSCFLDDPQDSDALLLTVPQQRDITTITHLLRLRTKLAIGKAIASPAIEALARIANKHLSVVELAAPAVTTAMAHAVAMYPGNEVMSAAALRFVMAVSTSEFFCRALKQIETGKFLTQLAVPTNAELRKQLAKVIYILASQGSAPLESCRSDATFLIEDIKRMSAGDTDTEFTCDQTLVLLR